MMNKEIIAKITEMREQFGWDESDTIESLVHAIVAEAHELEDSLDEDEDSFKRELADVLLYCYTVVLDKGYDLNAIMMEKANEVLERE